MPTAAIETWLASTVVEIVGVVLVITRYLFAGNPGDPEAPVLAAEALARN